MAYVDLKAAFESVDRNALWLLLASSGLPPEIINLFKALYTDTLATYGLMDMTESGSQY